MGCKKCQSISYKVFGLAVILLGLINISYCFYKMSQLNSQSKFIDYYFSKVPLNKSNSCYVHNDCYRFKDAKMDNLFGNNQDFRNSLITTSSGVFTYIILGSMLILPIMVVCGIISLICICDENTSFVRKGRVLQFLFLIIPPCYFSLTSWSIISNRNVYISFKDTVTPQFTQLDNRLYMNSLGKEYINYYINDATCYNSEGAGLLCYLDDDLFKKSESYEAIYSPMMDWFKEQDKFDVYIIFGSMSIFLFINNIFAPIVLYIIDRCVWMGEEKERVLKNRNEQKETKTRRKLEVRVDDDIYETDSIDTPNTYREDVSQIELIESKSTV